ncbi:hypothetical protein AWU67_09170 [Microterricola viridarii]|uniref:Mannosyltransferase (PIG-V) n=1 Tax=Microterricola viridarii TaxID=412690 RepID=A0A109QZ90_9MICO|nr:hypothetical protein AWU67_09170 [Microterricola viridarii]
MAHGTAARRRTGRSSLPVALRVRYRLTPWWLRVTAVFLLSRVVTTILVLILASVQKANPWTADHPDYFSFATMWDGRWYQIIAGWGYPNELPLDATGHVAENAWAFMPVYPMLVRGLMEITGVPWAPMAVFVSVACAFGTALLFYRMMIRVLPAGSALFAVALFCFAPLSPLLQFAYAESLYLMLLTLALLLLMERRYALLFPVVAVMALTRPSGLAFALALGLHVIYRFAVRRREPFPLKERVLAESVAVFSGVMGLAWLLAAAVATGDLMSYTDTELAWRAPYIGHRELLPFTPWFQSADWWLGSPRGPILVVLLIVAFVAFMFTPAVKRLGVDLRLWVASYALYLLAVFFPQSSVFRLLMPFFPLLGALAVPRSRIYRVLLLLVCVALQWGWLLIAWGVDGRDWTPP